MRIRHLLIAVLSLALAFAMTVHAQVAPALSAVDQKAVDQTLTDFAATLTRMDFESFGKLFTDDCDFINIFGMHWTGKPQVVKAHSIVFTTRYRGVPQHTTEKTESVLAPGVVLAISTIVMDARAAPDGTQIPEMHFRMTMVLEKHGERWLIRSAQNTVIDQEAAKHDPGHSS